MNLNDGKELYAQLSTMKGYELFAKLARKHRSLNDKEVCELLGACFAVDMHPFLVGILMRRCCALNDSIWNSRMGACVDMSREEFEKQHKEFTRKVFMEGIIDED